MKFSTTNPTNGNNSSITRPYTVSWSPPRIQILERWASETVFAFSEHCKSEQMCRNFEKTLSTETLVAGIAKKFCAIRAMIGNEPLFF